MFALTPHHRFYLYSESCDMRKGINGLSGLIRNEMDGDPLSGDIYVFINRSRNLMKLLIFESDGYLLYNKRLSVGRFQNRKDGQVSISYQELQFMIRGVDLHTIKLRKRFSLKPLERSA